MRYLVAARSAAKNTPVSHSSLVWGSAMDGVEDRVLLWSHQNNGVARAVRQNAVAIIPTPPPGSSNSASKANFGKMGARPIPQAPRTNAIRGFCRMDTPAAYTPATSLTEDSEFRRNPTPVSPRDYLLVSRLLGPNAICPCTAAV